ncbi:MAG: hypothetical protein H6Q18_621, partial [Bacteroidetes bacterium]|nr:hypothetical protein [Bacteroidota bacterium]
RDNAGNNLRNTSELWNKICIFALKNKERKLV